MPRIATKNRGPNNLSHLTFSVTSLFFSLIRRGFKIQQILRKLRKLGAATICRILRFFVTFLLFLYLPDGAFEFNKFWENCEKSWSQRFAALYDFSSLLCCSQSTLRGLPILTNPSKSAKNRFPLYYFSLYIFITSQKGRCKTHSACIALKTLLHSHWILQSSWHFNRSFDAQCVL